MDDLRAGNPASHVHRYTSYLTDLKRRDLAYATTARLPGRHAGDKLRYWGRASDVSPNVANHRKNGVAHS